MRFGNSFLLPFGQLLKRVIEHRIEDLLHSLPILFKTRKRVSIAGWWVGLGNMIGEEWICSRIVQSYDQLAVDAAALQARGLRQVFPKTAEEPSASIEPSEREDARSRLSRTFTGRS